MMKEWLKEIVYLCRRDQKEALAEGYPQIAKEWGIRSDTYENVLRKLEAMEASK